jgi:hypothetical protein
MIVYILRNMKYMNTVVFGVWSLDGSLRSVVFGWQYLEHGLQIKIFGA